MLHITNGDCAVKIMRDAGISDEILPWRDVLHEGPVPATDSLEKLSAIRTRFIADQGWGDVQAIQDDFTERDAKLGRFREFGKVVLWFEHDLYDQLQLLQILAWFAAQDLQDCVVALIQTDKYLGRHSVDEMCALVGTEVVVTPEQLSLAAEAWQAFCADTPLAWQALLSSDTSALPFLAGAVLRMLEEYPACDNGLSRTQRQALTAIYGGESRPGRVFGLSQDCEERIFMGDSTFWGYLRQMLNSSPPLLQLPPGKSLTLPTDPSQALTITKPGIEVLEGRRDWRDCHAIDRWFGGVHVTETDRWCWNSVAQHLVETHS